MMFDAFSKKAAAVVTTALAAAFLGLPVYAIPNTGDGSSTLMPVMAGLLGLSLILIIVYAVLSAKKKKRR